MCVVFEQIYKFVIVGKGLRVLIWQTLTRGVMLSLLSDSATVSALLILVTGMYSLRCLRMSIREIKSVSR